MCQGVDSHWRTLFGSPLPAISRRPLAQVRRHTIAKGCLWRRPRDSSEEVSGIRGVVHPSSNARSATPTFSPPTCATSSPVPGARANSRLSSPRRASFRTSSSRPKTAEPAPVTGPRFTSPTPASTQVFGHARTGLKAARVGVALLVGIILCVRRRDAPWWHVQHATRLNSCRPSRPATPWQGGCPIGGAIVLRNPHRIGKNGSPLRRLREAEKGRPEPARRTKPLPSRPVATRTSPPEPQRRTT